jgi:hypothetical protein
MALFRCNIDTRRYRHCTAVSADKLMHRRSRAKSPTGNMPYDLSPGDRRSHGKRRRADYAISEQQWLSPAVIQLRAGPRCRLAPHSGAGSINRLSTMRTGREESTMEAACAPLTAATCMLLATVQSASPIGEQQAVSKKLAQQNDPQTMTASASSDTRAEACSSSIDKAVNLCMIQVFFNIGHVYCDCTQSNVRGVPAWECVGTAMCKK